MSVLIAVPTRGYPSVWTVNSLQALRDLHPSLPPILYLESHLSVCDGRNKIVKAFLASRAQHLLMIDDDVVPCQDILGLADHGLSIVGSPVFVNRGEANVPFPNVFIYSPEKQGHEPYPNTFAQTGLVTHERLTVGTGCICISREVLEEIRPAFEHRWTEDGTIAETEDLVFCRKAHAAGFAVHADYGRPSEQMVVVAIRHLQERNAKAMMQAQTQSAVDTLRTRAAKSDIWVPA
jgi:hypothetical protein